MSNQNLSSKEYWELVERIKARRPKCTNPKGHSFIVYQGDGVQTCHDCGYTEDLVAKDDCNV